MYKYRVIYQIINGNISIKTGNTIVTANTVKSPDDIKTMLTKFLDTDYDRLKIVACHCLEERAKLC
jgi:hypothetical protein